MKRLRNLGLVVLLLTLATATKSFAQAEVNFEGTVTLSIHHPGPDDPWTTIESTGYKTTLTPSGNLVKTIYFTIPEGNYKIPEKGKSYIGVRLPFTYDENGDPETYLVDSNVMINKRGELKILLHDNGSGIETPNW